MLLTKDDSPKFVDQGLHSRSRSITGHLSFLVTMTRCDLAFAYTDLSKLVQEPGENHLKAAERVLQYLRCTYELGLVYSDPWQERCNLLEGWVDSDYASDPNTRK